MFSHDGLSVSSDSFYALVITQNIRILRIVLCYRIETQFTSWLVHIETMTQFLKQSLHNLIVSSVLFPMTAASRL